MLERLFLHIGANKTGSSAIQRFLSINSDNLRAEGIIIPNGEFQLAEKTEGQQVFGFQALLREPSAGRVQLESLIDELRDSAPEASTVILSAENLTAHPHAPSLFRGLREKYATKVIIYIRRQDDYLLSSWQQWYCKVNDDFWAWLTTVVGQMGNWRSYLQNWETVIPRENITVRLYERPQMEGGDAIVDFHNQLGLAIPLDQLARPNGTINPSYSDAIMEIAKGNPSFFRDVHDNGFYRFVQKLTGEKYVKKSRESTITFAQRQAILQRYQAANRWVKEHYFPDMPGELFTPPNESDYEFISQSELEKRKVEAMTSILLEMYKREAKR